MKRLCLTMGAAGGFLGGLMGVGGGIIFVPMLTGPGQLRRHIAHGTSLAIVIFVGVAGAPLYWAKGGVAWDMVAVLATAGSVGSVLGARLMARVPAHILRRLFGLLVLATAIRLLWP